MSLAYALSYALIIIFFLAANFEDESTKVYESRLPRSTSLFHSHLKIALVGRGAVVERAPVTDFRHRESAG